MNAKMSKSKKKKLKKRAKRNQQLMDQTMQHIVEVERTELLEKSGGSDQLEKDLNDEEAKEGEEENGKKVNSDGDGNAKTDDANKDAAAVNGQNGDGKEAEDENLHDDDTKVDGNRPYQPLRSDSKVLTFNYLIADIEKRKSFADMKLAEVATSPEFWDPDNHPPKSASTKDNNSALTTSTSENKEEQCNGHQEQDGEKQEEQQEQHPPEVVVGNGNGAAEDNDAVVPPYEFTEDGDRVVPPQLPSSLASKAVDPVTEVCLDLQVKIADLGNACWVVSNMLFLKNSSPTSSY